MPTYPKVIQVANVAPAATREQMKTLFGYVGRIDDIEIYPEKETGNLLTRVCYVKFYDSEDAGVALHLTNTVFIDRALVVTPVPENRYCGHD
jgi:arginine/serine-rich splicing factor 12